MVKAIVFLALCFCMLPMAAQACAMLERASPRVGSTIGKAPLELTLTFSDTIFPARSTITVSDAGGHVVSAGKPFAPTSDDRMIGVKLMPLVAGTYKVSWNIACSCPSPMPGHYSFTVQ